MNARKTRGLGLAIGVLVSATVIGFACSSPAPDARFVATTPDTASFPPVAAMLVQACGSLDCHGTVGRNLRVYGDTALRFSPLDVPSTLIPTTADEVAADYASVVGLEPEILAQVVASDGANPERLTLVQKARGGENHAGGIVVVPGDVRDTCMTTWLKGNADVTACTAALSLP